MRAAARRHPRQRPLLIGLLTFIVAAAAGTQAFAATSAEHPDYQGTYAGIATTNTGKKAPFTLFVYKRGDTMEITIASKGYKVRVKAPEKWVSKDSVQVDVTVPALYKLIATGSGTATFAKSAKLWEALGDGEGTLLVTKSGQVTGQAEMVTRGFDQSKANKWIAAHPISSVTSADDAGPVKALNTATPKVDKALLVVAPAAARPPIPDPEKLEILALLGLLMAILLVSAAFFGGKKPLREFEGRWTRTKVALFSGKVPEGGV